MAVLLDDAAASGPAQSQPRGRSGQVLQFARALLPGDVDRIFRFAAAQPRAALQVAELGGGRTVAILEVGPRRICLERRGARLVARFAARSGPTLEHGDIDQMIAALRESLDSRS